MQKESLEALVHQGLSQNKIASMMGVSRTSVRHWLNTYGLKTVTVKEEKSPQCGCGETDPTQFYASRKSMCKTCHIAESVTRQRDAKRKAVEHFGGCCKVCGFDSFIGALEFHHLDPSTKDPKFAANKTRTFEGQLEELEKCILLCANCHRGVHSGELVLRGL